MDNKRLAEYLELLLQLERRVVGVKLVYSKEEFDSYEATEIVRKMSYCIAVKCACSGHSIKLDRTTAGCPGSNRALGLTACDPKFYTGEAGCALGLYASKDVAKGVAEDIYNCEDGTYGVVVKPLAEFENTPDVILIVSNSREAMRVLQGYTYTYGISKGFCVSGNQAVCVESTVFPMKTKEMNVSMLCSGTRYHAKWNDTDVMSGIPIERAEGLVQGLLGTINPIEMNDRKSEIEEGLRKLGDTSVEIDYAKTYFKVW